MESRTRYFRSDAGGFYRERVDAEAEELHHEYWSPSDQEWKPDSENLTRYLWLGEGWFAEVDAEDVPDQRPTR